MPTATKEQEPKEQEPKEQEPKETTAERVARLEQQLEQATGAEAEATKKADELRAQARAAVEAGEDPKRLRRQQVDAEQAAEFARDDQQTLTTALAGARRELQRALQAEVEREIGQLNQQCIEEARALVERFNALSHQVRRLHAVRELHDQAASRWADTQIAQGQQYRGRCDLPAALDLAVCFDGELQSLSGFLRGNGLTGILSAPAMELGAILTEHHRQTLEKES